MEYSQKALALAKHLEVDPSVIEEKNDVFTAEGGRNEWMVLTDEEADERWEESLDNYIDECITPELPESIRFYFDDEKWKRDAKHDGRGHSLSTYDGEENEETVDGETFYIYRTN
jgi:hypothetical protein